MKTVLTKFLAVGSVALLMLASCKKEGTIVKSNGGQPGALTANVSTLPLDKSKVNDTTKVITFNFTKANFGYNAAVTNILQIDAPGDNWAHPTTFTLGTGVLSQGFSTADFNSLLLKLNLTAGVASPINVRVAHSLAVNVPPVYSNVLSLTVTPFNLQSWVYVPGAYEGPTWPNPGPLEDSLYSATDNGIYVGIINFTAGNNQFLVVPVKGSWAHKYATTDPNNTTSSTVTYDGPNNFYAPTTPGQYLVTLNINNNTISIVPADYYTLIGSAPPGTAWQNDYPMKYINDGTGTWVAANVPMSVGEYKVRQDGQWTNSWGPSSTAGMLTDSNPIGDGNIQLTTAGNHTISFVMPATPYGTSKYTNLPTYNNVAFPFVTTTYTATP